MGKQTTIGTPINKNINNLCGIIILNMMLNMLCDMCCWVGEAGINILNLYYQNISLIDFHMTPDTHGPCTLEMVMQYERSRGLNNE